MAYNETQRQQHHAARLLSRNYNLTRENILGDGLILCRRAKAFNTSDPDNAYIKVERKDDRLIAKMQDVARCGNAHLCPYCAGWKAAHMSRWIECVLVPEVKACGQRMMLLTLTAKHKRESDWTKFVENFCLALTAFYKTFQRNLKAIGSPGRARGIETPIGPNGLHLHVHDLIVHDASAVIDDAFCKTVLSKWKAALAKYGLHCSDKHGINIREHDTFRPAYIAKELGSTDAKTRSGNGLVTMLELLSKGLRGDKQANSDWIRAAKALQGRDRWNVGQLAQKLGIPTPSDWKDPERLAANSDDALIIKYPQAHHFLATSPANSRAGLAFILRAARQEERRPGSVQNMAFRMCAESIDGEIEQIKWRHARILRRLLKDAKTEEDRQRMASKQVSRATFEIMMYRADTFRKLFPAPEMLPLPNLWGPAPITPVTPAPTPYVYEFGKELEFV